MKTCIIAALVGALVASAAFAKDPVYVVTAPVKDKPTVTRDASIGYLLVRSDTPAGLMLMRMPTEEEKVALRTRRDEAFAKERVRNQARMVEYQ